MKGSKRIMTSLLLVVAAIVFVTGCKKDEDIAVTTYPATEVGVSTAICGGDVIVNLAGVSLTELGVCWSTSKNPTISDEHISTTNYYESFVCTLRDLLPGTRYHVRAYALRGTLPYYGKDESFKTNNFEGMTIQTDTITNISYSSALCSGKIEDDGGVTLLTWGFCWATSTNPTVNDEKIEINYITQNAFQGRINNLSPETTYYVRSFATNSIGTFYGNQLSFRTLNGSPVVRTNEVINVTSNSARFQGNVLDGGLSYVIERGFCWSTNHNPTINDETIIQGNGTGNYNSTVSSLLPGTVYYVKAYARNNEGLGYGEEMAFMTQNNTPIVQTNPVTNIAQTTAMGNGEVINSGGLSVLERGFCWSTTISPTISDSHAPYGTGLGVFSGSMNGLSSRVKYYYRAYAKNDFGIGYGDTLSFTTIDLPSVETSDATSIQATSIIANGIVTDDGGIPLMARGVCWGTGPNPTVSGNHTNEGTQTGSFSSSITNLNLNTSYYIRAYATNSLGTSYGQQIMVKTKDGVARITTSDVTSIMATTAVSGGNITDDGGFPITSRGVCWSTTQNPNISNHHTIDGTGVDLFISSLSNLSLNTVYYVRAYATNSHGTFYGEQKSFTTKDGIAIVTTKDITNIDKTTASSGGTISTDGGSPIIAKGVCWSLNSNPTILDSHTEDGTGSSSFNSNIAGLENGRYYYVRAYVINVYGTYYGDSKKFMTHPVGSVGGLFSVSASKKVFISKGNLQYQASTDTWRFAENQYDCIGVDNKHASQNYSGWIDLFAYGSSGYNGTLPWSCYGGCSQSSIANTYYDWGLYNPILNGGNQNMIWRTMTGNEWRYLYGQRAGASSKRSSATVNNMPGYIFLPDEWRIPEGLSFVPNASTFVTNVYSESQWVKMSDAGAVFLPAAGNKHINGGSPTVVSVGVKGYCNSTDHDFVFRFEQTGGYFDNYGYCISVRLVQDY